MFFCLFVAVFTELIYFNLFVSEKKPLYTINNIDLNRIENRTNPLYNAFDALGRIAAQIKKADAESADQVENQIAKTEDASQGTSARGSKSRKAIFQVYFFDFFLFYLTPFKVITFNYY